MGWSERSLILAAVALSTSACAQNFYVNAADWTPVAEARFSAQAPRGISIEGRQAHVVVSTGAVDSVEVGLDAGPGRGALNRAKECDLPPRWRPRVRGRLTNGALSLRADPAPDDECVLRWRVVVPQAVAVRVELAAGVVDIEDATGPLDLRLGVGDIRAHTSSAPIRASVGTGSIEVTVRGRHEGPLHLRSSVGDVQLFLEGRRIGGDSSPGPGSSLRMDDVDGPRGGRPGIDLSVDVGDVELRILGPSRSRHPQP
jgi:hypothetical protein